MKVCDLDLKAMPQLGDGAEKNFRPIYTIMVNTVDSCYLDPSYLDPITYVELISKS